MGYRTRIPAFNAAGLLPEGDCEVTFEQLRKSILVIGPRARYASPFWDADWRAKLVDNLEILTRQLWRVGVTDVFADGAFVENKDHPNGIDGYFVCDLRQLTTGGLSRELNRQDPHRIWTWDPASRTPYRDYAKRQLPMWHRYRVELYPHVPNSGIGSGVWDENRNELEFPAAFRRSHWKGSPKGIVKLAQGDRS